MKSLINNRRFAAVIAGGCCFCIALVTVYLLWNPGPVSTASFDKKRNGIWAGHQWFTGKKVASCDTVSITERDAFIHQLRQHGMRTVFVHAGPIRKDGTIADMPGAFFTELQKAAPEITFLPWIGGDIRRYALEKQSWRSALIATIWRLRECGARGVHLDIEPVPSNHQGYLSLLKEMRISLEGNFLISHATRRLAIVELPLPWSSIHFWTMRFYRECMRYTDQTVLMGYDTCIKHKKIYTAYMRLQTERLLACVPPRVNHSLMIGIPSYSDNPKLSDPRVENIGTAVAGIRAALERQCDSAASFDGVAIYAHWTTEPQEWRWFEVYWMQQYQ